MDYLADDYEIGVRIYRAGYRIELCGETVETTVPAYDFRGFCDHQLRWARSTRDSRRWGYVGLGITYCIPWAVLNCMPSGFALWSFTLLSLVLLARVSVALTVGVGILRDEQVLRDIWLLPLRDFFGARVLGVELRFAHRGVARRTLRAGERKNYKGGIRIGPAGRAPYAGGGRSHAFLKLRAVLPMVGTELMSDHREHHAKPNTRHEVTAARAGHA